MGILYVSQTVGNGYAVGNDGTAVAGSKATPWLTTKAAIAAAISGSDTLMFNDGTYDDPTYYTINKQLIIEPENDYLVTFTQAGGGARVFHIPSTGTGTTFGKVVVDAENAASGCITVDSTATVSDLTLDGTELKGFTSTGLNGATLKNFTAISPRLTSASCNYGIVLAPNTAGTYDISNPVLNLQGVTNGGIRIAPSVSGNVTKVYGTTGTFTATAANFPVIELSGCAEVHAYSNESITIIKGSGIMIPNSVVSSTAYVYDNAGLAGGGIASSKYGIVIGQDTSNANDHNITLARYDNNHVSGFDHNQFLSYVTNAKGFNTSADNGSIGHLIKGCVNSRFVGAVSTRMTTAYHQIKGSTGSYIANSAYIISAGYDGTGLLANADTALVVDNSGCGYANVNGVSEIDPTKLININTSQDVAITNHNHDAEITFTGNIYNIGATNYTSAATLNADALASGCVELASSYKDKANENYSLLSSSALVGAGVMWWTSSDPRPSTAGEPLPDFGIDIGHIQSTHNPFHPAN